MLTRSWIVSVLLPLATLSVTTMEADEGWEAYKAEFSKMYRDDADERKHYAAFVINRNFIEEHMRGRTKDAEVEDPLEGTQQRRDAGNTAAHDKAAGQWSSGPSYDLALSRFSDWLDEEIDAHFSPMTGWNDDTAFSDMDTDIATEPFKGVVVEGGEEGIESSSGSEGGAPGFPLETMSQGALFW